MDASGCRFWNVWFFYSNPKHPDFKSQPHSEIKEVDILELLFYLPSVRLYLGAYGRITNTKWIKSSGSYQPLKLCFVSNTASVLHTNNVHINIHE